MGYSESDGLGSWDGAAQVLTSISLCTKFYGEKLVATVSTPFLKLRNNWRNIQNQLQGLSNGENVFVSISDITENSNKKRQNSNVELSILYAVPAGASIEEVRNAVVETLKKGSIVPQSELIGIAQYSSRECNSRQTIFGFTAFRSWPSLSLLLITCFVLMV